VRFRSPELPPLPALLTILLALLMAVPADAAPVDPPSDAPAANPLAGAVGLALDPGAPSVPGFSLPPGLRGPSPSSPCLLLMSVDPDRLDDPDRFNPLLDAAAALDLRVIIRLTPGEDGSLALRAEDWSARVGSFARRLGDRVAAYQFFEAPAALHSPRLYAYLLKQGAVAVRASGSHARILLGGLGAGDAAWADELFEQAAEPYIDILAAHGTEALPAVLEFRSRRSPRTPVWVLDARIPADAPRPSMAADYILSLTRGAEAVLFSAPPVPADDASGVGGPGSLLADLRSLITPALTPASAAALPFGAPRGPGVSPETVQMLAFFNPRERRGLAAYRSTAAGPAGTMRIPVRAPLDSLDLFDPRSGEGHPLGDQLPAGSLVEVPLCSDFLLLRYRFATQALPLSEETRVGAEAELSAQEIIARERAFQAAQNARLSHYEAHASVAIHYRIATLSQSVDVVTESRLYVHDGKQDYEQTELRVDGARWRGKEPPYLPFLQPEKVQEVPLDITLDEGYRYALEGRDRIGGRECYVISFEPTRTDLSLYSGRVYIDTHLFARVRMEGVQTGLSPPLRANQVSYHYEPVEDGGATFWLPTSITGQMVFEVLGQNLVVEREAAHTGFAINRAGIDGRLRQAQESGRPIFRETDKGYFRLTTEGGEERLRSASVPRNVFLVMGASAGFDGDPGLPFAGVNFFDFDYKGSGHQVNIAWAGPFANLSWTDPRLREPAPDRRPWALSLEASLNALRRKDRLATDTGTRSRDELDLLRETVKATLAIPLGHFTRLSLEAAAHYVNFAPRDKTDDSFVLPRNTTEGGLLLRLEYSRSGYLVSAWGEGARRASWRPWGTPGTPFSPDDQDYTRLGMAFAKSFFLEDQRKISLGFSGFEGRGLDRFSRFELGDFRSARVRGFNGSGIHFDRGLVTESTYSFTLGDDLRFDLSLETGWIQGDEDFGPGYERVVGAGLGVQFSGPWSTLGTVRLSRGLSSTIADKGGGGDVRVVFFRTFDRWSRRKSPPPGPGALPGPGPSLPGDPLERP